MVLSAAKLILGYFSNSISLISDGFNNLTDMGNSIITYIGYKITNKPADRDHPYGHGRAEYITSQLIAIMIIYVGIDLFKESLSRLISHQGVTYSIYTPYALILAILIKVALGIYYQVSYNKTSITTLKATSLDAFSDSIITTVTFIGYLLRNVSVIADALIGLGISVMVCYNGIKVFGEMSSLLLSEPVTDEDRQKIKEIIDSHDEVKNPHDFRFHNYGKGHRFGSGDVQIEGHITVNKAHEIIDEIESEIFRETGIEFTIHTDPISQTNDPQIRDYLDSLVRHGVIISYHDLVINKSQKQISVDIVMHYESINSQKVIEQITSFCTDKYQDYRVNIRTDFQ